MDEAVQPARSQLETGLGECVEAIIPSIAPYVHRMPMSRPADMPIDC